MPQAVLAQMWYDKYSDLAMAVLGAATGLASVLLVFVGFLLNTAGSFSADTDDSIPNRYLRLARIGLIPVLLCCAVMLTAFWWFFDPGNELLLKTWAWGFPIATLAFAIYAVWAVFVL